MTHQGGVGNVLLRGGEILLSSLPTRGAKAPLLFFALSVSSACPQSALTAGIETTRPGFLPIRPGYGPRRAPCDDFAGREFRPGLSTRSCSDSISTDRSPGDRTTGCFVLSKREADSNDFLTHGRYDLSISLTDPGFPRLRTRSQPPRRPSLKSSEGGTSPTQQAKSASAKDFPSIVPWASPPTATSVPVPGW